MSSNWCWTLQSLAYSECTQYPYWHGSLKVQGSNLEESGVPEDPAGDAHAVMGAGASNCGTIWQIPLSVPCELSLYWNGFGSFLSGPCLRLHTVVEKYYGTPHSNNVLMYF